MVSKAEGAKLLAQTIKNNLKRDPHFYDPPEETVGQEASEGGKVAPVLPPPDPDIVAGLSDKERRELQERIAALDHSVAYWRERADGLDTLLGKVTGPNLPDHLETWPSAYSPSAYWHHGSLGTTRIN